MPKVFDYKILFAAVVGIMATSPIYFLIGRAAHTGASLVDIYIWTTTFVVALLVGYEFFFVLQTMTLNRKPHIVFSPLDDRIPFTVGWVWIYSVVYYVLLGLPLAFFSRLTQGVICIAGGFVILLLSSIVYLKWPTRCPPEWRNYKVAGMSSRLLAFVQRMDAGRNCCPSLHCTLAAYTASFIPSLGLYFAIPALICLSCLFVKQHSVKDLVPGLLFGFSMGAIVSRLI